MPIINPADYMQVESPGARLLKGLQIGRGTQSFALQQMQLQAMQEEQEKQAQIKALLSGQQVQPAQPTEQEQMLAAQTAELAGISPQAEAEQPQPVVSQVDLEQQAKQIDPIMAEKMLQQMGMDTAAKRADASRFAARVQSLPPALQEQEILQRAEQLRAEGRDPSDTLQLLDMNQAERSQALTGVQLLDLSTKERFAIQAARAKAVQLGGKEVKSSKILDDGTTVQSMKDGTTQVISPTGEVLTGDARATAVKEAQRFGVELQGKRAQQREGGKGAAKIALNAFDQVGKIRGNISNLQEGIRLVREEGAETGPIADKFPSFRASTKTLENLRARLGLDVVGAVTFGALSEGELGLALDVALPKGLNEKEIVEWMGKRIVAQQKLANNLEEAALFLSEPGNTVADFIRYTKSRDKQRQPATPPATPAAGPAGTTGQATNIGRFQVEVSQ